MKFKWQVSKREWEHGRFVLITVTLIGHNSPIKIQHAFPPEKSFNNFL